jgi:hypothetical protein
MSRTELDHPNVTTNPPARMPEVRATVMAKLATKLFKRPSTASLTNIMSYDAWSLWVARWLDSKDISSSDFSLLKDKLVVRELGSDRSEEICSDPSRWSSMTGLNPLKPQNSRRIHWLVDVMRLHDSSPAIKAAARYDLLVCDLERFCSGSGLDKTFIPELMDKLPHQSLLYGFARGVFDSLGKRPDLSCSCAVPSYERYLAMIKERPYLGAEFTESEYGVFVQRKAELLASHVSAHLIFFWWP